MTAGHLRWKRGVAAGALAASLFALVTVHEAKAQVGRVPSLGQTTTVRETFREHHYTKVTVTRDIAYRNTVDADGTPDTLHLDVYSPVTESTTKRPVVIWLHSGGFIAGNKSELARYASDFAERGYVSVAIDYRQRPHMDWFDLDARAAAARDAYDDSVAAIAWVRAHADKYHADPRLIFAAGYSAGALTAFDLADPPAGATPAFVAGAMSISGYGIGAGRAGGSPVIDFHGTNDQMVPFALADQSCKSDRAVGVTCNLVTFKGLGHEIGNTKTSAIAEAGANFFADIIAAG